VSAEIEESPSAALVSRARDGDRAALDAVLRAVQDRVYRLALRMLGDPDEAKDAVQDILVRIVRHLDGFRGDSAFTTWVYRVAANQLLTHRRKRAVRTAATLDAMGAWLDAGLRAPPAAVDPVLVEESKLICTQAMLQCLDPDHRLAYILGEVVEVTSEEGGAIVEATPETFRKRLERARERIAAFTHGRCGLVDERHPCRCDHQIDNGMAHGLIDVSRLRYAHHPAHQQARRIEQIKSLAAVLRSQPAYASPIDFAAAMRAATDEL
jgi:RNA polymerase sigma factor (sigma-70 family)